MGHRRSSDQRFEMMSPVAKGSSLQRAVQSLPGAGRCLTSVGCPDDERQGEAHQHLKAHAHLPEIILVRQRARATFLPQSRLTRDGRTTAS